MKIKLLIALLFVTSVSIDTCAETINNDTIVTMEKAGLGEGLIVDKINSESCGYDVSIPTIINLKKAGLSDTIISAMVRRCTTLGQQRGITGDDSSSDPKVRHSPGIYIAESWLSPNKLLVLPPSKSNGLKTTGNGSIFFPFIYKMVLLGNVSHLSVPTGAPIFYFYFDASDSKVSDFGLENSIAAQSPDEFNLVKLKQKGDSREIDMGRLSFIADAPVSIRNGVDPKTAVQFNVEELGNKIYKVSVENALATGEYAFVLTGANHKARVYDFSVVVAPIAQAEPMAIKASH